VEGEELIAKFEDDLKIAGRARSTRSTYVGAVRQFSKFMKGNLTEVRKDDLKDYLNTFRERDRRASTVKWHFTALREFYECMVDDEVMAANPITAGFRNRFLKQYKAVSGTRYCPTIDEVKRFLGAIINTRDLAICIIVFAYGLRRNEIRSLNIDSINLETLTILVTPTPKRTNLRVFFTDECAYCLARWIKRREAMNVNGCSALFLTRNGGRMSPQSLDDMFRKYSRSIGFTGTRIEEKLTLHCARHFHETSLFEAGVRSEYIDWLRGDKPNTSAGVYRHINPEKVKAEYELLAPRLGIL
jgi:site-specific recombinase XerD